MRITYNIFRWYRPGWGRYTQSDPIGLDGGTNLFSYADANPLSRIDPLGLAVNLRCRRVGIAPGLSKGDVAGALGYNHCYLEVVCPKAGIPTTTISYLGQNVGLQVAIGGISNVDVATTKSGDFDQYPVKNKGTNCDCEIEKCLSQLAKPLHGKKLSVYNEYWGPNSNSVAHRLILECGGKVAKPHKAPGWDTPWNANLQ